MQELIRQIAARKDLIVDSCSLKVIAEPEHMVIDIPKYGGRPLTQWVLG